MLFTGVCEAWIKYTRGLSGGDIQVKLEADICAPVGQLNLKGELTLIYYILISNKSL